jgi:hypothetical protein
VQLATLRLSTQSSEHYSAEDKCNINTYGQARFNVGHSGALWAVDLDRSYAGIVGCNSALGMEVFSCFSMLCCLVTG